MAYGVAHTDYGALFGISYEKMWSCSMKGISLSQQLPKLFYHNVDFN